MIDWDCRYRDKRETTTNYQMKVGATPKCDVNVTIPTFAAYTK